MSVFWHVRTLFSASFSPFHLHFHIQFLPEHNVIVKGCVNNKEEDASMKVRELNVPLYWANKEKVKGEGKSQDSVKKTVSVKENPSSAPARTSAMKPPGPACSPHSSPPSSSSWSSDNRWLHSVGTRAHCPCHFPFPPFHSSLSTCSTNLFVSVKPFCLFWCHLFY